MKKKKDFPLTIFRAQSLYKPTLNNDYPQVLIKL
jgi:hypothetical protein